MSVRAPWFRGLHFTLMLSFVGVAALSACARKEEPAPLQGVTADRTQSPPKAEPSPAPTSPVPAPEVANPQARVLFTAPKGWKEMPLKPMRKATYQAEGKSGPAEIAVFYFGPGDGGGVEANISRWIGQFEGLSPEAAKRTENNVGTLKVHEVRVEKGTYASGMPGGPTKPEEGWGMHAAVVETPAGNYFFKMLGPSQTVIDQEANFTTFLQSLRVE